MNFGDFLGKITTPSPSANIREQFGYQADPLFGMSANPALGDQSGSKNQPGGKKGGPAPNAAADELAKISSQLFQESDPLRKNLIGRSQDFLNGNLDVTQSPMYGALKAGQDTAFQRAKSNTIATTPSGGGLSEALANLEQGRATNMAQGIGGLAQDELSRATGLATGSTPTAVSGTGQAAAIQAQQLQQQQQQNQQAKSGAGSALGTIGAAVLAK